VAGTTEILKTVLTYQQAGDDNEKLMTRLTADITMVTDD